MWCYEIKLRSDRAYKVLGIGLEGFVSGNLSVLAHTNHLKTNVTKIETLIITNFKLYKRSVIILQFHEYIWVR